MTRFEQAIDNAKCLFMLLGDKNAIYANMDQNLKELENRLKFYETISSNICYKIPLDKDEFLSSPEILDEIIHD